MENKNLTAVEWLVEQYANENYSIEVYEQAKQMEKEQIIQAASLVLWHNSANSIEEAEQYYNEKYGENKD